MVALVQHHALQPRAAASIRIRRRHRAAARLPRPRARRSRVAKRPELVLARARRRALAARRPGVRPRCAALRERRAHAPPRSPAARYSETIASGTLVRTWSREAPTSSRRSRRRRARPEERRRRKWSASRGRTGRSCTRPRRRIYGGAKRDEGAPRPAARTARRRRARRRTRRGLGTLHGDGAAALIPHLPATAAWKVSPSSPRVIRTRSFCSDFRAAVYEHSARVLLAEREPIPFLSRLVL